MSADAIGGATRDSVARIADGISRLTHHLEEARAEERRLTDRLAALDEERVVLAARLAAATEELSFVSDRCAAAVAVLRPEFAAPVSLKRELVRAIFASAPLNESQEALVAGALAGAPPFPGPATPGRRRRAGRARGR